MTLTRRGRHAQDYAPQPEPQEATEEDAPTLTCICQEEPPTLVDDPESIAQARALAAAYLTLLAVSPPF